MRYLLILCLSLFSIQSFAQETTSLTLQEKAQAQITFALFAAPQTKQAEIRNPDKELWGLRHEIDDLADSLHGEKAIYHPALIIDKAIFLGMLSGMDAAFDSSIDEMQSWVSLFTKTEKELEILAAFNKGDGAQAIALFLAAFEQDGQEEKAIRYRAAGELARLALDRGDEIPPADLIEVFGETARLHPDLFWAWENLAKYQHEVGAQDESLHALDQAFRTATTEIQKARICFTRAKIEHVLKGNLSTRIARYSALINNDINETAHSHIATILNDIAGLYAAERNTKQALNNLYVSKLIQTRLITEYPENLAYHIDLSLSLLRIVDIQFASGNRDGSFETAQAQLSTLKELAIQYPENVEVLNYLFLFHSRLGKYWNSKNDFPKAITHYRAWEKISSELVAQHPDNLYLEFHLLLAYANIGTVNRAANNLPVALSNIQRAQEGFTRLSQIAPKNLEFRRHLYLTHEKLGDIYLDDNDPTKAKKNYAAMKDITEQLIEQDPENPQWERNLMLDNMKVYRATKNKDYVREALEIAIRLTKNGELDQGDEIVEAYQGIIAANYN